MKFGVSLTTLFCVILSGCKPLTKADSGASTTDMKSPSSGKMWAEAKPIPETGTRNPFNWPEPELSKRVANGKEHLIIYPVTVTGGLLPWFPFLKLTEALQSSTWGRFLFPIANDINVLNSLLTSTGLSPYPKETDKGVYSAPYPALENHRRPTYPMGLSLVRTPLGLGASLGCPTCHAGTLFGKTVFGLTTRFPKINQYIGTSQKIFKVLDPVTFQKITGATDKETEMYSQTRDNFLALETKVPEALGLDTSFSQTALSLTHRNAKIDG